MVSAEDYKYLSQFNWHIQSKGYVCRQAPRQNGKRKLILLHRVVLDRLGILIDPGMFVDHINRNKIDNTRSNLRVVTPTQNNFNRGVSIKNKSGILGVYFHKRQNKYIAQIKYHGKAKYLGSFSNKIIAGVAYQNAKQAYAI